MLSRQIAESDWKIFRRVRVEALERYCRRVLSEVAEVSTDDTKSFHKRYLDVYQLIHRRDDELATTFNNPRRSTAFFQIAAMYSLDLFTDEEYDLFSDEVHGIVALLRGDR